MSDPERSQSIQGDNMIKRWWFNLPIGTRSLLLGAHQFAIHPFFVAWGWSKLYGFPIDPRLWVCFFVHDLGYFGKPNMDGDEGELHPLLGAAIVRRLFGPRWSEFCLLHSRFMSRRLGKRYSRLCPADKMAIVLTPTWLYIPLVTMSGELPEYMGMERESKYHEMGFDHSSPRAWYESVKRYIQAWVETHKDADRDDGWLVGNGDDVRMASPNKLPGYMEGGYKHNKYTVLKTDGSPINPSARYMVMRYDKDRDPHGIFGVIAYAVSVSKDNESLYQGIIKSLYEELGISEEEFFDKYSWMLDTLEIAADRFRRSV